MLNWRPFYWDDLDGSKPRIQWGYRACVTGAFLCFAFVACIPIAAALAAAFD